MLNFHKKKINSTTKELSTLSYQHNNLNKFGCMEIKPKVPGFLARVYLNKSLFNQAFIDKTKEAKESKKTDDNNLWWASRPIDLDWNTLEKNAVELNNSCQEIVSNASKKNNLFFILASLDRPVSSGGAISDLHIDDNINKSSIKSDDKYSVQDLCYVFANFSDWKSRGSNPSFPTNLTIDKICTNSDMPQNVTSQERNILVNYIQNFAEQWNCETIKFESGKSNYGYDNGKKKVSVSTKHFSDVPGVCPTPKIPQRSREDVKPLKTPLKATDITAGIESNDKEIITTLGYNTPEPQVKPDAKKTTPDPVKPDAKKTTPDPVKPDAKKTTPDPVKPDAKKTNPDPVKPDAKKTATKKPEAVKPVPVKPATKKTAPPAVKPASAKKSLGTGGSKRKNKKGKKRSRKTRKKPQRR